MLNLLNILNDSYLGTWSINNKILDDRGILNNLDNITIQHISKESNSIVNGLESLGVSILNHTIWETILPNPIQILIRIM